MSAYKNIKSEGRHTHSEGDFRYCVRTPCTELNKVFSLNCRGLAALIVAAWLRAGRDTQGERGA